jgi:hypothetical protein
MWRAVFKPRYKRQFDIAHSLGLKIYFHCCGRIDALMKDFVDVGVDIMNIGQPNVCDIEEIGRSTRGSIAYACPISYQTTSITGTRDEIIAEGKRLYDNLSFNGGGFIGYVEEYHSVGLSEDNYDACIEAFEGL